MAKSALDGSQADHRAHNGGPAQAPAQHSGKPKRKCANRIKARPRSIPSIHMIIVVAIQPLSPQASAAPLSRDATEHPYKSVRAWNSSVVVSGLGCTQVPSIMVSGSSRMREESDIQSDNSQGPLVINRRALQAMIIGGFLNFRPRSVTMQTQKGRRNKMEPVAAPAQVASGQRQVGDWEILCGTPASSRSH
ncbi:hypothetical protein I7I51_01315 [Histoplasma capsulatum]|uniref:Uncharacterized protein n=1 Tax=Ajellomyces capsulatus TaxID=5037 RepID=A0A8A1MGI1_AJECA|nr:hypothetical protein I7I51_01315 [Histoplasma capsulatum]